MKTLSAAGLVALIASVHCGPRCACPDHVPLRGHRQFWGAVVGLGRRCFRPVSRAPSRICGVVAVARPRPRGVPKNTH